MHGYVMYTILQLILESPAKSIQFLFDISQIVQANLSITLSVFLQYLQSSATSKMYSVLYSILLSPQEHKKKLKMSSLR